MAWTKVAANTWVNEDGDLYIGPNPPGPSASGSEDPQGATLPGGEAAGGGSDSIWDDDEDEEDPGSVSVSTPNWQSDLRTEMRQQLRILGQKIGLQDFVLASAIDDDWSTLMIQLQPYYIDNEEYQEWFYNENAGSMPGMPNHLQQYNNPTFNGRINVYHPIGRQMLFDVAMQWASNRYGLPAWQSASASGSGSGRRGSGSRLPSPDEIRKQFDMDELTDSVVGMGRAYLVEELENAADIAKAYVDEVVAVRAQQEIDFETFVKKRLKKNPRWQMLYRNKPEGVDEMSYLQPYVQAAMTAMGGGDDVSNVSGVVAGGAALGATPDSFAQRLAREDKVQSQAGFINALEQRVAGINQIFRG